MNEPERFQSLAPVLLVEAIAPSLAFWRDRLGFEVVQEVPDGDELGFVMLVRDGVTVMVQSRNSLRKDIPQLAEQEVGSAIMLYISVASIDEVERALDGVEQVVPRRETFYGATEIAVREPAGYVVVFAQHAPATG